MALILSGDTGVPASGMPTGSVIQTVNFAYASQAATTSTTPAATGLTATITPISVTSKILITVFQPSNLNIASGVGLNFYIYKNGSQLVNFDNVAGYFNGTGNTGSATGISYLDSPATTSATTYSTYFALRGSPSGGGSFTINYNGVSTITLMEIKV
jgi:hypothetical protein